MPGAELALTPTELFGEDAKTQKQVALKNMGDGYATKIWTKYVQEALGGKPLAEPTSP